MSLVDTPSTALYTPSGVQIFGIIDPDALNTSFAGVASAFNLTTSVVTGDTQLSATVRNVGVNIVGPIVVTLPPSPSVGDPPCLVYAQYVYRAGVGSNFINATITTSDANPINSITPNAGTTNMPALYNDGDIWQFVFVGGTVGWLATGRVSNFADTFFGGTPPVSGAFPWQGQSLFVATTVQPFLLSVESLQVVGARAAVCRVGGTFTISMGDATSTFNGIAGPYVISTSNILYKFTCLGGRAFMVTV